LETNFFYYCYFLDTAKLHFAPWCLSTNPVCALLVTQLTGGIRLMSRWT